MAEKVVRRALASRPLRVAVNGTAYDRAPSGARNRTVGLCAALLRAGVHIDFLSPPNLDFGSLVADELGTPLPVKAWREQPTRLDPEHPLRRALAGPRWVQTQTSPQRHDLFLTDYYPVATRVPTALSVHDLRYLTGEARGAFGRQLWFRTFYPRIARRAALVLTLTGTGADEAVRLLGVPRRRVVIVPIGVSRVYRTAATAEGPGRHLLAVGMGDERKGADVLCAALRQAAAPGEVLPLVMTGRRTPFIDRVLAQHHDLAARGLLRYEGVVEDTVLVNLYQEAAALLHPSRYEGFGVPVLEALSMGAPVVAACDPAVKEVAGSAASYLPADDIGAWAEAMRRVSHPATAPVRPNAAGLRRAEAAGWDAGAQRLLAALETVRDLPRGGSVV